MAKQKYILHLRYREGMLEIIGHLHIDQACNILCVQSCAVKGMQNQFKIIIELITNITGIMNLSRQRIYNLSDECNHLIYLNYAKGILQDWWHPYII